MCTGKVDANCLCLETPLKGAVENIVAKGESGYSFTIVKYCIFTRVSFLYG